ncbi:hypothetical protein EON65_30535 [archaeon]|nr:MAG: hypothetical protein EON65_30535 [archaeon]
MNKALLAKLSALADGYAPLCDEWLKNPMYANGSNQHMKVACDMHRHLRQTISELDVTGKPSGDDDEEEDTACHGLRW